MACARTLTCVAVTHTTVLFGGRDDARGEHEELKNRDHPGVDWGRTLSSVDFGLDTKHGSYWVCALSSACVACGPTLLFMHHRFRTNYMPCTLNFSWLCKVTSS